MVSAWHKPWVNESGSLDVGVESDQRMAPL